MLFIKDLIKTIFVFLLINNIFFLESLKASENKFKPKTNQEIQNIEKLMQPQYILDNGDVLAIIFSGIELFSGNYSIRRDGTIILPEMNELYVKGLTVSELEKNLNELYKESIIMPDIKVYISSYRPVNIYLSGEIKRPGLYTLSESETNKTNINEINTNTDMLLNPIDQNNQILYSSKSPSRVFDALVLGKGITKYADLSSIKLIRNYPKNQGGGKAIAKINILSMIETGDQSQNIELRDGDSIHVPKSKAIIRDQLIEISKTNLTPDKLTVYINGNVLAPGMKIMPQGTTLYEAIASAGGSNTYTGYIDFIRFDRKGNTQKSSIKYSNLSKADKKYNPIINDGDIIIVKRNLIGKTAIFMQEISTPIISGLGLYEIFN